MKTFRAGNIEVLEKDLYDGTGLTWENSIYNMRKLGKGWRFPTVQEMEYINELSKRGVGLIWNDSLYWVVDPKNSRPFQSFGYVLEIYDEGTVTGTLDKEVEARIRPVRDIR